MKKWSFAEPDMLWESRLGRHGRGRIFIIEILIFIAVFLVASVAEGIPVMCFTIGKTLELLKGIDLTATDSQTLTEQVEAALPELLTLFSTALLTVAVCIFCRYVQERSLRSTGLRKEHAVREYLIGAAFGTAMISVAVLLGAVTGMYELHYSGVSLGTFLLYTLGYMVQGMSEEVLCRGYFMTSLARRYPAWLAVVISSVFFALLHLGNPGVNVSAIVNLTLSGLVFGTYILRRGDIWGACAMHSFWNLIQGNFFGISVSGTTDGSNTLFSAVAKSGTELWTGGRFGIESGLLDTIVELAALAFIIFVLPERADTHHPAPVLTEAPTEEAPAAEFPAEG